ncbi:MAG TPA: oxidoreductase [Phycisphaerales bacterium]|nr:oxidoreductase [Phycisphaerales bacterium]
MMDFSTVDSRIKITLIGAGNRGRGAFGRYALNNPHKAEFVAVVEPDDKKRNAFAAEHNIPESGRFKTSDELFKKKDRIADAVIIATLETERLDIVLGAIDKKYNILVEKPLGCTMEEVIKIADVAGRFKGIFAVCHQMRYVSGYAIVKSLIESGRFGKIIAMQHSENLSYHHMAHSFVRGLFNNDSMTPMILAKSCHDMDIMRYLIDKRPLKISSFGSLNYFRKENAPKDAPDFCLQGCPAYKNCPYDVQKIYFNENTDPAYIRQMGVVKNNQELFELLRHNQFGRCVFKCDNNVVDHQVVQIEFEDGITGSFQMAGHNYFERRITKISLTNGEIYFDVSEGIIKACTFSPANEEIIKPAGMEGSHLGGDNAIMDAFVDAISTGEKNHIITPVEMSLDSHVMAFAAEKSRLNNSVVDVREFENEYRKKV